MYDEIFQTKTMFKNIDPTEKISIYSDLRTKLNAVENPIALCRALIFDHDEHEVGNRNDP